MERTSVSQITTLAIAGRVDGYDNGIVFTEQPVALGTVFQVKILEYDGGPWARFWNGTIVSG